MTEDYEGWYYDSVVSRTAIDSTHIALEYLRKQTGTSYPCYFPDSLRSAGGIYSTTIYDTLTSSPAINMTLLPEEYMQSLEYFYNAADTTFCAFGGRLTAKEFYIFENCDNTVEYRFGLGMLDSDFCQMASCWPVDFPIDGETWFNLTYYRKSGTTCGYPMTLSTPEKFPPEDKEYIVYPIPVGGLLYIRSNHAPIFGRIIISNILGQIYFAGDADQLGSGLDVTGWPDGVYVLAFESDTGVKCRKVVVRH